MRACVCVSGCLFECVLVGEGELGASPARLASALQRLSRHTAKGGHRNTAPPSTRQDPQIPSSSQQQDYGS